MSSNSLMKDVRIGSSGDDLDGHDMMRATAWLTSGGQNREKSIFEFIVSSRLGEESVESRRERMVNSSE